ncbi:MAG TPA: c-type cytochrome [Longimicrobiaceae bacterium]|jgi:cytochrome c553|nr:c-type cytochrome [Longimicrobiaceae bacterium]
MPPKRRNAVLKWLAIAAGTVVMFFVLTWAYAAYERNRVYEVPAATLTVAPRFAGDVAHGKAQVVARGCWLCHGTDLGGKAFYNSATFARLASANLTGWQGGNGHKLTDTDWALGVRHALGPDRRSLIIMPSVHYDNMSDEDLRGIIEYARSLPPVKRPLPAKHFGPVGNIAGIVGILDPAASSMSHTVMPAHTGPGVSAANGKYLVRICAECHAEDMHGLPPGFGPPPGPDLSTGSELRTWSEADFIHTLRTGVTPTGRKLAKLMPVPWFKGLTDDELRSMWAYLHSLPPRANRPTHGKHA